MDVPRRNGGQLYAQQGHSTRGRATRGLLCGTSECTRSHGGSVCFRPSRGNPRATTAERWITYPWLRCCLTQRHWEIRHCSTRRFSRAITRTPTWRLGRDTGDGFFLQHIRMHRRIRLTAKGYKVVYQPLAVVYHQEGTTFGTDETERKQMLMKRNRQVVMRMKKKA